MPPVDAIPHGVRLTIHAQPRAALTQLAGLHGDAIKVRLSARPVDGAANEALVDFLADRLGVARAALRLTGGAAGRRKTVEAVGVTPVQARQRLGIGE